MGNYHLTPKIIFNWTSLNVYHDTIDMLRVHLFRAYILTNVFFLLLVLMSFCTFDILSLPHTTVDVNKANLYHRL